MTFRAARLALALFVICVPLIGWAVEVGVAVTASHVMGLVVIALAFATWWQSRPPLPLNTSVVSILAFFVVATITVVLVQREPDIQLLGESTHSKSIRQLIGLGFGLALFLALHCLLSWYGLGLSLLRTHYWTTAVFAFLALAQYGVAVFDIRSPLANFPVQNSTLGGLRPVTAMYGFPRISVTMVEPSMLATYLLSGWAFWLYSMDHPTFVPERERRTFIWSGLLLGVAIIVTGSRLAYVIFLALAFGALIVRPARLRRAGLLCCSLVVGLLLVGAIQGTKLVWTLIPKFDSSAGGLDDLDDATRDLELAVRRQDISVQQRTASYLVALRVFRERPILGAGLGTSGFYMERYWPESFVPLHKERPAIATMLSHYAVIAAETGTLGLVCLSVFAFGVTARLWRLKHAPDGAALAWGLAASVGGYAIGAAANPLMSYQILLIWLLLALALTATTEPALERTARPPGACVQI